MIKVGDRKIKYLD